MKKKKLFLEFNQLAEREGIKEEKTWEEKLCKIVVLMVQDMCMDGLTIILFHACNIDRRKTV